MRDSLDALAWLQAQGCRQIIYKVCSTFDSTPEGNIGPVAAAVAQAMSASVMPVCPAFPAAGRTVYQGHLFVFDKLLSASGMESHPLTPMTDPDIRRWLGHQTTLGVGHLSLETLRSNEAAARKTLQIKSDQGPQFVIADAVADDDLLSLGRLLDQTKLIVGGSGVAMGLPRNLIDSGLARGSITAYEAIAGPGAILAGSCSGATRGQVDAHTKDHPVYAIDVAAVMSGEVNAQTLIAFIEKNRDRQPLVYSSGTPEEVSALQSRFGREEIASRLDKLFAETSRALLDLGYRRLVIAGGETSGAVAQAVTDHLGAEAMHIGPEIDPGVPILTCKTDQPVALALKSGNFGASDFFAKALRMMGKP